MYLFPYEASGDVITRFSAKEEVLFIAKSAEELTWFFIERNNGDRGWVRTDKTNRASDFSYRDITINPDLVGEWSNSEPQQSKTPKTPLPTTQAARCHDIQISLELSEVLFRVTDPLAQTNFYKLGVTGYTGKTVLELERVEKDEVENGQSYSLPNSKFTDEGSLVNTESRVIIQAYATETNLICEVSKSFVRENR